MTHGLVYAVLWVNFQQQMHMVWHDFHFNYIGIYTFGGFNNQLLQPLFDFAR